MKIITLLTICFLPLLLLGQEVNITGRWEGYLDQSAAASKMPGYKVYWDKGVWKKGVKTHRLRLTFKEKKRADYHVGEYYINDALNKAHYGRFAIKATYSKGKVHYETTSKIFEVKNSLNLGFCYSEATLKWSEDSQYEYLEGTWRGWNEERRACANAHVWLRRRKRTPTPPPPPPPPPVEQPKEPVAEPPVVATPPTEVTPDPKPVEPETQPKPVAPLEKELTERAVVPKQQFEVSDQLVDLAIWDHDRADGDVVSLVHNGQVILSEYTLTTAPKWLKLKLQPGKNVITLIAHNLGTVPPNTATVEVHHSGTKKRFALESDFRKSESVVIIRP